MSALVWTEHSTVITRIWAILILISHPCCLTRTSRVGVRTWESAQHDRLQGGGQVFGRRDARAEHHLEGERCPVARWVPVLASISGLRLLVLDQERKHETSLAWPGLALFAWSRLFCTALAWIRPTCPRLILSGLAWPTLVWSGMVEITWSWLVCTALV